MDREVMTDHTPGPWHVENHDPEFGLSVGDGAGTIASVGPCGAPDEEDFANANLISAAPELLRACRLVLAICDNPGLQSHPIDMDPKALQQITDAVMLVDFQADA